ncbi:hypothetical protein [Planctobacterium marinum]|uniref:hypothetical protein n=1 Tax=Planctobacterium marinum TaxID=1631968 RepID=UPI001E2A3A9C|nr:hypothetical protein [Planctobacterium marinum]MCC2604039.1 hypothetical protein [Planctobacterium marinum]
MFNKKLQVEKVEMVKKIIRKYDYGNYEATHKECVELGLNVNRPALDRFGEKLQMLDSQAKSKSKLLFDEVESHSPTASAIEITKEPTIELSDQVTKSDYGRFASRSEEITFELGALRIRENELLTELSEIKKKTSN